MAAVWDTRSPLTLTLLPWPSGSIFPPAPFSGITTTQDVLTMTPKGTAVWNLESISVLENEGTVIMRTVTLDLLHGENVKDVITTSTLAISSSTLAFLSTEGNTLNQPSITSSDASTTSLNSTSYSSSAISAIPTRPTTTPILSPARSSGVSSGAMAGIAIGCLIAGALFARLIA
jgi:hypothetical protein